jgi:hypothetical protein
MLRENPCVKLTARLAVAGSLVVLAGLITVGAASSNPTAATARPVFEVRGITFCIAYYRVERLSCSRRGNPSSLSMKPKGSVRIGTLALKEPVAVIRPAPLTEGETWSQGGSFSCVNRRSGLTCRNASGHGWWLGSSSAYRTF